VAVKLTGWLLPPARIGNNIPESEKHFSGVVICFRWTEAGRTTKRAAIAGRP